MENFTKVKAIPCNPQGKKQDNAQLESFLLNNDLIAAIKGGLVILKSGSNILSLNESWYINIRHDE